MWSGDQTPVTGCPVPRCRSDKVHVHAQGAVVWEGSVEEFDTCDVPIVRQFASGSLDGPIQYE